MVEAGWSAAVLQSVPKEYDAAYYQRTKTRRREQKRAKYDVNLAWYRAFKESRPCTDCGRHYHHAAMQFDHLPGSTKRDDVCMLLRKASRETVLAEIASARSCARTVTLCGRSRDGV